MIRIITDQLKYLKRKLHAHEAALNRLPKGCLVRKMIKGKPYFYLVNREGAKVRTLYIGKVAPHLEKQHGRIKTSRKILRHEISAIKKEISYRGRLLKTLQKASDQGLEPVLSSLPILRLKA